MSKIVSTKFHVNTVFLRVFMEASGPQAWEATKYSGLIGLNLYSVATLIVDLSFDGDLEF